MKTKKMRNDIENYKVNEKIVFLDSSFVKRYKGRKYLDEEWNNVPDVLVEEYYEKKRKLENISEKIKDATDDWIKVQKELISLENSINKLMEVKE